MTTRIMLVDDQEMVRMGLRMVLGSRPEVEVVAEAGDGEEALAILATTEVDVVVMDVRMPRMGGVEATRRIREREDGPRVLVLTTFDLDEYAFEALQAGASGFLLKDTPVEELVAALRHVQAGDAVVAPTTTRRLLDRFSGPGAPAEIPSARAERLGALTPREREVLLLVAQGLSNAEIAEELVLSDGTVKVHVGRILTKLDLRDRVQAVVLAYETGLVRAGQA